VFTICLSCVYCLFKLPSKPNNDHNSTPLRRQTMVSGSFESSRRDLSICGLRSRHWPIQKTHAHPYRSPDHVRPKIAWVNYEYHNVMAGCKGAAERCGAGGVISSFTSIFDGTRLSSEKRAPMYYGYAHSI
jgi:hypothetical protein